jgi:hypothetical protein
MATAITLRLEIIDEPFAKEWGMKACGIQRMFSA